MLLSFSEPAMLPMVVQGIVAADGELEPGTWAWMAEHFARELDDARGRTKRRTMRRSSGKGWWLHVKASTVFDLWWLSPRTCFKNPTDRQRPRKLGRAKARVPIPPQRIELRHTPDNCLHIHPEGAEDPPLGVVPAREFARADGFENQIEMFEYFAPKPGDTFEGFILRW